MSEDRDLRDAFRALGTDHSSGPTFDELTSGEAIKSVQRRHRRKRTALLIAAIAIPSTLIVLARADRGLDYERFTALTGIDLGEVTWEAPSDFLLNVPGRELLGAVPHIDVRVPVLVPDSARRMNSNDTIGD